VAGSGEHEDRDGPRRPGDGAGLPRWSSADRTGDPFRCGVAIYLGAFTERLEEIGARPSIGTVADSYDNALAETTNGLYKTECVYGPDATGWDDVDELELATLSWVHWFNEDRLHGHCEYVPPAEYEAAFYAAQEPDPAGVGIQ
jgi:putative transposase